MAKRKIDSKFAVVAVVMLLLGGTYNHTWCDDSSGQLSVDISVLNVSGLPVLDCLSKDFWEQLESDSNRESPEEPIIPDHGKYMMTKVNKSDKAQITVVSGTNKKVPPELGRLFERIGFIPYMPGGKNAVFVDQYGDLSLFSGTAIPPIAARQGEGTEHFGRMVVARGMDGKVRMSGGVAGAFERLDVDGGPLFVLMAHPEGLGELEKQRTAPEKELLVAWDQELQQLPALHFDELGTDSGGFWIQRNVDAFQVPASYEGPWFATSWHCPHYYYQYSLLDPVTGVPSVLLYRLYFLHDGDRFSPTRVSIDLVEAAEFNGSSAACQRFISREEILDTRFGRYKGEERTVRGESGTGAEYLDISMSFTRSYLEELRDMIAGLRGDEVSMTGSVVRALRAIDSERDQVSIVEETVVEIGGVSPKEYFGVLCTAPMGIAAPDLRRNLADLEPVFECWAVREVKLFEIAAGTSAPLAKPGLAGTQPA